MIGPRASKKPVQTLNKSSPKPVLPFFSFFRKRKIAIFEDFYLEFQFFSAQGTKKAEKHPPGRARTQI
jgi:hypothetical protein